MGKIKKKEILQNKTINEQINWVLDYFHTNIFI